MKSLLKKIELSSDGQLVQLFNDIWAVKVSASRTGYLIINDGSVFLIDAIHPNTLESVETLISTRKLNMGAVIFSEREWVTPFMETKKKSKTLKNAPALIHNGDANATKGLIKIRSYSNFLNRHGISYWHFSGVSPGSIILSYQGNGGIIFTGGHALGSPFSSKENSLNRPNLNQADDEKIISGWENLNTDIRHILPSSGKPIFDLTNFEDVAKIILDLIDPKKALA